MANDLKKSHPNLLKNIPSGRMEVILIQDWFNNQKNINTFLKAEDINKAIIHLGEIISLAFKEILRHIYLECKERGELLY